MTTIDIDPDPVEVERVQAYREETLYMTEQWVKGFISFCQWIAQAVPTGAYFTGVAEEHMQLILFIEAITPKMINQLLVPVASEIFSKFPQFNVRFAFVDPEKSTLRTPRKVFVQGESRDGEVTMDVLDKEEVQNSNAPIEAYGVIEIPPELFPVLNEHMRFPIPVDELAGGTAIIDAWFDERYGRSRARMQALKLGRETEETRELDGNYFPYIPGQTPGIRRLVNSYGPYVVDPDKKHPGQGVGQEVKTPGVFPKPDSKKR